MDQPHLLATLEYLHGPPLRESQIGAWATFFDRPKTEDRQPRRAGVPDGDTPDTGRPHDDERLGFESHTPTGKNAPQKAKKKGAFAGMVC